MPADSRLTRAARHLALPQLGSAGQARIEAGTVLIVGAGGLGNPAAAYLAVAGVRELIIADFDRVDETNLGRQFLFGPADVGLHKVDVTRSKLESINPDVRVTTAPVRIDADSIRKHLADAGVVLDCTDNFRTRSVVADACAAAGVPIVAGSAIRFEGQVAVFGPDYVSGPCYRCLYTDSDESLDDCAGNGVFGPVPGVIGTLMAVEALKLLADLPVTSGQLTLYDASSSEFRAVKINKRADCAACS